MTSALFRERKYDEANTFVTRVSDNLEKIGMTIDVHNDFLNSKLLIASERGIRVICASSSKIDGIDDIDLCNLLGNILDNAIGAAKYCHNGYIEVTIRSDENMVLVIVANTVIESVIKINLRIIKTGSNKWKGMDHEEIYYFMTFRKKYLSENICFDIKS